MVLENKGKMLNLNGEVSFEKCVIDKLGIIPLSVWKLAPDTKYRELKNKLENDGATRVGTFKGASDSENELGFAVSVFNPVLAELLIRGYTLKPNSNVYDPFAGGIPRAWATCSQGHNYFGVEIRQDQILENLRVAEKLHIKPFYLLGSSTEQNGLPNNSMDLSVACPPYYDLETYNGGEKDLSMLPTYGDFLREIKKCIQVTFNVLKDDGFVVWVVGNFRDNKGRIVDFRGDLVKLFEEVGFHWYDDVVYYKDFKKAVLRVDLFEQSRKNVKTHEYIMVFKKTYNKVGKDEVDLE